MVALILFVVATIVALILFDQFVHENADRAQSRMYVEENGIVEHGYASTSMSIFSVLGFCRDNVQTFTAFRDRFRSFSEVSIAMREAGMDIVRLIVGIDFSASNEWQGRRTFRGECLHSLKGSAIYNPYQKVLHILGQALQPLLQGQPISAFGFADLRSRDKEVFSLKGPGLPCTDFMELLDCYTFAAQRVQLSGPTNFAPLIDRARSMVEETKSFHLLLIITDGQLKPDDPRTRRSLIQASSSPLSIVAIGVGDGPWIAMEEWDDRVPDRKFDNFHFLSFHHVTRATRNPEAALALHTLMEVPDQYQAMVKLGYFSS